MEKRRQNYIVFVVVGLLMIGIVAMVYRKYYRFENYQDLSKPNVRAYPFITCIMITGKDQVRTAFAKQSIQNFIDQTYPSKNLLIINHGDTPILHGNVDDYIFEFMVPKKGLTLGDLRNIALQMIPYRGLWTTWDDDDWRSPDYLSTLQNEMQKQNADMICISKRIDYNYNTKFGWVSQRKDGFVLFLAPVHHGLKYSSKDTMEDVNIVSDARRLGLNVYVYENSPLMYIRLIHTNNTSLWANPKKNSILPSAVESYYVEKPMTKDDHAKVNKIMSVYYKDIPL